MAIPLGRSLPSASCDRPERRREGSPGIFGSLRDACRSYLVLLPVGFSLPPPLPAARCALTAPFHPCHPPGRTREGPAVYFLWHFPWGRPRRALPGTVPPWSPDFPLPAHRRRAAIRPSGTEEFGLSQHLCQSLLSQGYGCKLGRAAQFAKRSMHPGCPRQRSALRSAPQSRGGRR